MPPEKLRNYRIVEKLGEGAMGEVYLARDETLDRTVAVKVLPEELASDPERMGRFVQEARAASAIKHPNVAHIYEIGESDGVHFIAMEHVEGKTLAETTLELSRLLDVAIQAADALDEAHSRGIVHRDLKPSNLMLTARDQVKILDFGLAKFLALPADIDASDAPTRAKTREGVVMGTVSYMSPEQALGRDVDARSDLFSLGVVLYQLVAGRLPFAGASVTETIDRIAHAQPEALARFHYDVPAELDRIIRKCLEKSPSNRYQSARELLVDLKNLKRDRESGGFASARPRRSALLAVALGALLLAGAAIYWLRDAGGAPVRSLAVLPFENASGDVEADYLGDGIAETLTVRLARLPGMKVISSGSVFRYRGRAVEPGEVRRDLDVDAVVRGRISQRGASLTVTAELVDTRDQSLLWGEQYVRDPDDLLAVQDEIVSALSQSLRVRLTGDVATPDPASAEAYQAYLKGRFYWNKRSEEGLRQSIEYFQQAVNLDPSYALAYVGLADAYNILAYYYAPPREFFPRARAAAARALEIEDLAEAHASLGYVQFLHDWDWERGEASFRRAIELDPGYSNVQMWYATLLSFRGDHEVALSQIRRGLELDPLSLIINTHRGLLLTWAGRYEEAVDFFQSIRSLDPSFGPMYHRFGDALLEAGRMDEAIDAYEQGMRYTKSAEMFLSIATGYALAGEMEKARQLLSTLQTESKERYVSPVTFAAAHAALGEREQARAWLERAFEERASSVPLLGVLPVRRLFRDEPRFAERLRGIGHEPSDR